MQSATNTNRCMNKFKNMTHSQGENNITRQDKIDVRIDRQLQK